MFKVKVLRTIAIFENMINLTKMMMIEDPKEVMGDNLANIGEAVKVRREGAKTDPIVD